MFNKRYKTTSTCGGLIPTFDNPAIFAEVLLQGLVGGLSVQPTDEQLTRTVCLGHSEKQRK